MALTLFCQKCGKRFDLDENMAGRRARCKQCQHEFVIPGVRPASSNSTAKSATGPAPTRSSPVRPPAPEPRRTSTVPSNGSIPPRPTTPVSNSPVVDPFGLEEAVSNPKDSPPLLEDEELLLPRRVRPVSPVSRKARRRDGGDFAWLGPIVKYGLAAEFLLFAAIGVCWLAGLNTPTGFLVGLLALVCITLWMLGAVMCLVVPFLESVGQGLLCLFVPFYSLYYTVSRWESMKRPFLLSLCGSFILSGAVILPAMAAARNAARQVQQAQLQQQQVQPQLQENTQRETFVPKTRPRRPVPLPVPLPVTEPIEGDSVVLNLRGVTNSRMSHAVALKINAIMKDLNARGYQSQGRSSNKGWRFTIKPVPDPQAFADRITFGSVTSVRGGTIEVVVTPESLRGDVAEAPGFPAKEGFSEEPPTPLPR
jgi:DNA-directed RNA polymerase subunit RPC12/RpoP